MAPATIGEIRQALEDNHIDLKNVPAQRLVGSVPLKDGHRIEILAPVPVFFSVADGKEYGAPCYVATGSGERCSFTYMTGDADIGFMGSEADIAGRVAEYLSRNWRGVDWALDNLIDGFMGGKDA